MNPATAGRVAIRCINPDLTDSRVQDEDAMRNIGVQLGYAVDATAVVIDPVHEDPTTTILNALHQTRANAVLVPNLHHANGIDVQVWRETTLITASPVRLPSAVPI